MMSNAKMEDKIKLAELLVEEEMLEEEQEIQYKQRELQLMQQDIQQKEHELKQMEQELKTQQQELQHIMVQLQIRKEIAKLQARIIASGGNIEQSKDNITETPVTQSLPALVTTTIPQTTATTSSTSITALNVHYCLNGPRNF